MRIRKEDQIILDRFFPKVKMKYIGFKKDIKMRSFISEKYGFCILINDSLDVKVVSYAFSSFLAKGRFKLYLTFYNNKIVLVSFPQTNSGHDKIEPNDRAVLEEFLPDTEMKLTREAKERNVRSYSALDTKISLTIGDIKYQYFIAMFLGTMIIKNDIMNGVIANSFNHIVAILADKSISLETILPLLPKRTEKLNDDFDEDEYDDDKPYAYTNGRWSQCTYCGSKRISTYCDGTAECDDCGREFRYM